MATSGPYKLKKGFKLLGGFNDTLEQTPGLERQLPTGETLDAYQKTQEIDPTIKFTMNGSLRFDRQKFASNFSDAAKATLQGVNILRKDIGGAIGGIIDAVMVKPENHSQPDLEQEKAQAAAEADRYVRELSQSQAEVTHKQQAEVVHKQEDAEINKNLGNQINFNGLRNTRGELRVDVVINNEVAQQEKITQEQREASRAETLAMASGKGKGEVNIDQNKAGEGVSILSSSSGKATG